VFLELVLITKSNGHFSPIKRISDPKGQILPKLNLLKTRDDYQPPPFKMNEQLEILKLKRDSSTSARINLNPSGEQI
jgi:hypothetical protein